MKWMFFNENWKNLKAVNIISISRDTAPVHLELSKHHGLTDTLQCKKSK